MIKGLHFLDGEAFEIQGALMSLVYAIPFLGGWIADHLWGNYKTVLVGIVVMCLGSMLLTLPIPLFFYMGLGGVIVGSGFSKPNLPTLLGKLYEKNNPKREEAFNWYFFSINVGILFSPVACGIVAETYGWHYGFLIAGVVTFFAVFLVLKGRPFLELYSLPPQEKGSLFKIAPYGILLAALVFSIFILCHPIWMETILPILVVVAFVTLFYIGLKEGKEILKVVGSMFVLMFFFTVFFSLYEQSWMSINLFIDRHVDRSIMGLIGRDTLFGARHIPTTSFQMLFGIVLILLPITGALWTKLQQYNLDPSVPLKGFFGLLATGLSFTVLDISGGFASDQSLVSVWWVVGSYTLLMLAEVLIVPTGIAMVSKFSPKKFTSIIMGIWFLAVSCSQIIAVFLAKLTCVDKANIITSSMDNLNVYTDVFNKFAWVSYSFSGVLLIVSYFMRSVFKRGAT